DDASTASGHDTCPNPARRSTAMRKPARYTIIGFQSTGIRRWPSIFGRRGPSQGRPSHLERNTILMRFDADGMATLLATPGDYLGRIGSRWPLTGDDSAVAGLYRAGRAARADHTAGPLAEAARLGGPLFPVAVPVIVDGALCGAMSAGSRGPEPPLPDLKARLPEFTELLVTAIANAES